LARDLKREWETAPCKERRRSNDGPTATPLHWGNAREVRRDIRSAVFVFALLHGETRVGIGIVLQR
jgi:hypothetical protein